MSETAMAFGMLRMSIFLTIGGREAWFA